MSLLPLAALVARRQTTQGRVNRTTTKDEGHHDDQGQGRGGDAGAEGVPRIASQQIRQRSGIDQATASVGSPQGGVIYVSSGFVSLGGKCER